MPNVLNPSYLPTVLPFVFLVKRPMKGSTVMSRFITYKLLHRRGVCWSSPAPGCDGPTSLSALTSVFSHGIDYIFISLRIVAVLRHNLGLNLASVGVLARFYVEPSPFGSVVTGFVDLYRDKLPTVLPGDERNKFFHPDLFPITDGFTVIAVFCIFHLAVYTSERYG